ncbi:hypothetical protein TrRE_jg3172, partial [Triparma retinervis]
IPNSQVRFERKGGTTMTKGECFKEVIARAKVNAAAGKQHMILVLCKDDGEMVVDGLLHGEDELKEGHVLFLHSGLRRTQEISKRLEDFKNGRGELLVIISTQPVTGLDCKFLCELDVMGSWNIVCLYQGMTRVARVRGKWGTARCWLWGSMERELKDWESNSNSSNSNGIQNPFAGLPNSLKRVYCLGVDSYIEVWLAECIRGHLGWGRTLGGRATCADPEERDMEGKGAFAPCNVCDPLHQWRKGVSVEVVDEGVGNGGGDNFDSTDSVDDNGEGNQWEDEEEEEEEKENQLYLHLL